MRNLFVENPKAYSIPSAYYIYFRFKKKKNKLG